MSRKIFEKTLTSNDTGRTGSHQVGVHIPKSLVELLEMLPSLDPSQKNPSVEIDCTDQDGRIWRFKYIYYNNSRHSPTGTRDEFRITRMTGFFRRVNANPGDTLQIVATRGSLQYNISVISAAVQRAGESVGSQNERIRLRGWRRVH